MTADERGEFEALVDERIDAAGDARQFAGGHPSYERHNERLADARNSVLAALRSPRIAAAVALADAELAWREDPREGPWQALLDATERYRKATGR